MPYAIGVDVGTTNTKVVLCELPSCEPVLTERFPSPMHRFGDKADYEVHELVSKVLEGLSACAVRLGARASEVELVSVASVGESGVLVYPDDSFSPRSIAWYDKRGGSFSRSALASGYARDLYRITGVPTHSASSLFKLLWMRDAGATLEGATWLTMADFIAWVLCGEKGQDRTLASRTSAYDVRQDCVSKEILDHYGLPHGVFAKLVDSGSPRGCLLERVCEGTGLPDTCRVCVSGHDHMSGAFACEIRTSSELLNSTGTSEGLLRLSDDYGETPSDGCQVTRGRYVDGRTFTSYASLPTAGLSFDWALRALGMDRDSFFEKGQEEVFEGYLKERYKDSKLLFIPHLRGSGPPHRSVDARANLYGLRDETPTDEVLFAVFSGVCFEFASLFDSVVGPSGAKGLECVKVIGPAVRNPLWMQLKADLIGVPFVSCEVEDAVARGSVLVSATKCGLAAKLEYSTHRFLPSAERSARLLERYEREYLPLVHLIEDFESAS
ncbi:Sugar (pentulose or hexulose) kinase [Parafannyhessea umbonata]|uniref:Sugar (Pentulose or hexulose) kinase n=1 Tax=Parafannyhessea umbonata TaxID=604330 RepID=A0A1H9QWH7_9ACTN|nr:Sugar (pentulose or hexulose) kinase [Parafannyhessea umbonata]